jgi:hypothetical protein
MRWIVIFTANSFAFYDDDVNEIHVPPPMTFYNQEDALNYIYELNDYLTQYDVRITRYA